VKAVKEREREKKVKAQQENRRSCGNSNRQHLDAVQKRYQSLHLSCPICEEEVKYKWL